MNNNDHISYEIPVDDPAQTKAYVQGYRDGLEEGLTDARALSQPLETLVWAIMNGVLVVGESA